MTLGKTEKKKDSRLWYIGSALTFLLIKGKSLLALLKFGKFGGAIFSMVASIGAYALIYPWQFAMGIVLLLFIHEMGHVIAAKQKGLPVSAPLFIPFLGAMIGLKKHPQDAKTEAYIAMGGPILGTIGAIAVFIVAYYTDSPLLYSLAYVGFFLNLINLLPIHPLDGGRIATAVSRWLWLVGLIGGLGVIIYMRSILFFIIWALFAYDLYKKYVKGRRNVIVESFGASFIVPVEHLYTQGIAIPGPEHKRELPFCTYCNLDDQRQYVTVEWVGIDFKGRISMPQQGIIKRVHVTGLEHQQLPEGYHIKLNCKVEYSRYENDKYYEVPLSSRYKFGFSYALLAVVLIGMMFMVHNVGNIDL
ncbi:site-2 protease family protein [Paenibacillus crassostreae]|nr:site-2 protease family protein [Paenibacillus crassostreae]